MTFATRRPLSRGATRCRTAHRHNRHKKPYKGVKLKNYAPINKKNITFVTN